MEMRDATVRSVMRELALIVEQAQHLERTMAEQAGFYCKRVGDVTPGDEIGYGDNHWRLVFDVEARATHEGHEVYVVRYDNADESDPEIYEVDHFDPQDWVEAKAIYDPEESF